MTYDNPFRVAYQGSADANAALAFTIPVPAGFKRFKIRHVGNGAVGFSGGDTATHAVTIGTAATATAFANVTGLVVNTANPGTSSADLTTAFEIGDNTELLVARAANGSVAKAVATHVVVDWF